MIKKRTRPQPRIREPSPQEAERSRQEEEEDESKINLADLLELQKLRKAKQGIDAQKLGKGDAKKRRRPKEEQDPGGLRPGAPASVTTEDEVDEEEEEAKARARRAVRVGNFTGQTNALDVDKHMMAYIEDNLKIRSIPRPAEEPKPLDPQEELYRIPDRWKADQQQTAKEEGNVTNSAKMLTAIPEVDLGMDARLKNIEDTEKAKRTASENRPKKINGDEEHLVAQRFYRPNFRPKPDADIMRDAKLEAMGIAPHEEPKHERNQAATDEMVMERFKKRMRK